MAGVAGDPSAAINNAQLQGGWYNPNVSDWQNAQNVATAQQGITNQFQNYGESQANLDPNSAATVAEQNSGNEGGGGGLASLNQAGMPTPSTAGTPGAYTLDPQDFTNQFYIGQNGNDNTQQAQEDATAALQRIKKYDPNASLSLVGDPSNWGSSGSDGGQDPGSYYTIKYDASKLPKPSTTNGEVRSVGGTEGGTYSLHDTNNNAMLVDPNYGVETSSANIYQPVGLMDRLGSMLPMAAAMFGAPAILGSVMGGMGTLQGLANGQGLNLGSVAGSALGALGGVGGVAGDLGASGLTSGLSSVMPYINAAKTIYGLSQGNPSSAISAGRMVYNGINGG